MALKRKRAPLVGLLPFADIPVADTPSAAAGAPTTAVDLSPCCKFLAVANAAGSVCVLPFTDNNLQEGAAKSGLRTLKAAAGLHITWCEFSPDSARLAAATTAGKVFIWRKRDAGKGASEGYDEVAFARGDSGDGGCEFGEDNMNVEETQSQIDKDVSNLLADLNGGGGNDKDDAGMSSSNDFNNVGNEGSIQGVAASIAAASPESQEPPPAELSEFEKMRLEMLGAVNDYKDTQELLRANDEKGTESPRAAAVATAVVTTTVADAATAAADADDDTAAETAPASEAAADEAAASDNGASSPCPSPMPPSATPSPRLVPKVTATEATAGTANDDAIGADVDGDTQSAENTDTTSTGADDAADAAVDVVVCTPDYFLDMTLDVDDNCRGCYSCRFSPSGRTIVLSHQSGALQIWDVHRRERTSLVSGHKGEVLCCGWGGRADDRIVVSGSADHTVRLWLQDWDFEPRNSDDPGGRHWRQEWCFKGHTGPINSVTYVNGSGEDASGDGGLGSAGRRKEQRLWQPGDVDDFDNGGFDDVFGGGDGDKYNSTLDTARSNSGIVGNGGPVIVTGSWDGTIRVWCPRTMCQLHCLRAVSEKRMEENFVKLRCVAPCPSGIVRSGGGSNFVLACDDEGACSVYDLSLGKPVASLLPAGSGQGKAFLCKWVPASATSSSYKSLMLCGTACSLVSWDAGEVLPQVRAVRFPYRMDTSDDTKPDVEGDTPADGMGGAGGEEGLYGSTSGDEMARVTRVVFSSCGTRLAVCTSDGLLRMCDAENTGTVLWKERVFEDGIEVGCIAFSPDNRFLVCGGETGVCVCWRWDQTTRAVVSLLSRPCLCKWQAHEEAVISGPAFSEDARVFVTGSWDNTMRLWNVATTLVDPRDVVGEPIGVEEEGDELMITPAPLATVSGFEGWVKCAAVSGGVRAGAVAVGIEDGSVHTYAIQDLAGGDVEGLLAAAAAAASGSGGGRGGCSMQSGAPAYRHEGAVNAVRFGLGGDILASCSDDATIKVWSLSGKTLRYTLGAVHFSDVINDIFFGGRGASVLCSASADGMLRCFNARNSDLLVALGGHTDECLTVAAAPEAGSHQMATGSADGTVRYWSVDADEFM